MVQVDVVSAVIEGLITLGIAALGSVIIWLTIGKNLIIKHGGKFFWKKLEELGESPESPDNVKLARVLGTQVAYMMDSFAVDMQTEEGRKKYAPIFEVMLGVIQSSIYGTWGNIVKKLQAEGGEIAEGLPGGMMADVPDIALKLGEIAIPKKLKDAGVGVGDLVKVASWISGFTGRGNGGSTPPGQAYPMAGGHGGGLKPEW